VLPFGVLTAAIARLPLRLDALRGLLGLDVGLALLFALIGLYQAVTHTYLWHNPKLEISNLYADFFRVSSVFYDPSMYGRFLAVALLLVAAAAVWGHVRSPAVLAAVAVVLFAGLAVSYSQSSFVALAVGLAALAALAYERRAVAIGAGVALALVLLALATPPMGSVRHALADGDLSKVTSTRSGLVSTGARLFVHHPVQGVGFGGFLEASKPGTNAEAKGAKGASHVMPLTVAAELGLPGAVLLVVFLLGLARMALAPVRGGRETTTYRLTLGLALLVILVHSLFYAAFWEDPLMWGLAALLAVAARPAERRSLMVGAA
jgi:O-antigen ligase